MLILTTLFTVGTLAAVEEGACWRHSQDKSKRPLYSCPVSQEQEGDRCYPKCASTYTRSLLGASICRQICPSGYKDSGRAGEYCQTGGYFTQDPNTGRLILHPWHVFIKHTYSRGSGEPMGCKSYEEQQGGFCVKKSCPTGYTEVFGTCWQNCQYTNTKYNGGTWCCDSKSKCYEAKAKVVDPFGASRLKAGDVLVLSDGGQVEMCDTSGEPVGTISASAGVTYIGGTVSVSASVGRRLNQKSEVHDDVDETPAEESAPPCLHAGFVELAKELGLDGSGSSLEELIASGDVILDNPEVMEENGWTLADLVECDDEQRAEDPTEAMPAPGNFFGEPASAPPAPEGAN